MFISYIKENFERSKYKNPKFWGQVVGKIEAVEITSYMYMVFYIHDSYDSGWYWRISLRLDFAKYLEIDKAKLGQEIYFEILQHGRPYVSTAFILEEEPTNL